MSYAMQTSGLLLPDAAPEAPAAPVTYTLTAEQLDAIVRQASADTLAAFIARGPAAPTVAPLTVDNAAPTICDACTARMEPCSLHGGVTAAPTICDACTARMEPCRLHGGTVSARPAAPSKRQQSDADADADKGSPQRDLTEELAPLVAYGKDWSDLYGPDTRHISRNARRLILIYASEAKRRPHSLRVKPETTGAAGKVLDALTARGPDRKELYTDPETFKAGRSISMRATRMLALAAREEAKARLAYREELRALAAGTTAKTDAKRAPERLPQNEQYHSVGASGRRWSDADLADAMREAKARGGSIEGMHVVKPPRADRAAS